MVLLYFWPYSVFIHPGIAIQWYYNWALHCCNWTQAIVYPGTQKKRAVWDSGMGTLWLQWVRYDSNRHVMYPTGSIVNHTRDAVVIAVIRAFVVMADTHTHTYTSRSSCCFCCCCCCCCCWWGTCQSYTYIHTDAAIGKQTIYSLTAADFPNGAQMML